MRSFYFLAALCFAAPAFAAQTPSCAGRTEIANAKIVRVEKNGALILADGRAALLEGIRLPLNDGSPAGLARDALAELNQLATARPLLLTATPPKEDRYDRVRVQAFGDAWLQTELLQRGLARVQISADRNECALDLYNAERQARAAGRGLWAFPAFAIRKPDSLKPADEGSFQIVEGKVVNSAIRDSRVFLDFSADYRRGLSATVAPEDHAAFRHTDPLVENLAGHTIRIRGMVQIFGGRLEIALSNPAQIEFLN